MSSSSSSSSDALGDTLTRMAERLELLLKEEECNDVSLSDSICAGLESVVLIAKRANSNGELIATEKIKKFLLELNQLLGITQSASEFSPCSSPVSSPRAAAAADGRDSPFRMRAKKTISARACVVCGRDDRPGQQRKSGFKCLECIGTPNHNRFDIKVDEKRGERSVDDDGGKTINDYAFITTLGKGSYAKVKLCVHNVSGQTYACKVVDKDKLRKIPKPGGNGTALDSVVVEVQILKALRHPNVVTLYEVLDDPDGSKMYLVMEYCDQGPLFKIGNDGVAQEPPVETERLKKYIVAIGHGLQYLHDTGIVHRDVKPDNILKNSMDHVKLTDFGVSAVTGESDILTNTEGSPAYMPPEEYDSSQVLQGTKADIWAFGVTIYALAFGKLPFFSNDLTDLADKIKNDMPEIPDGTDADLVDLLLSMLEKNPADRISMADILSHQYVKEIRTVKGQAVETVSLRLGVCDSKNDLDASSSANVDGLLYSKSDDASRGFKELSSFLSKNGPEFHIALPSPDACTLYIPRGNSKKFSHSYSSF